MTKIPAPVANGGSHSDWSISRASQWPLVLFVAALCLAYGYEVFSFNLTIDEEVTGEMRNTAYAQIWQAQGRWAMALLTLAVPTGVVPVVSTGLGVALSGAAWWLLCRMYLNLGPWASAVGASLAGTVPVLAFLFAFSTISFGIGVGNLFLVAYMWGLTSVSWRHRIVAVFAGAAALGIYDTFLFAAALLSLALIYKRANLSSILLGVITPAVAFILSKLIGVGLGVVLGPPQNTYVNRYLDIGGLFADPASHSLAAAKNFSDTLWLSSDKFGLHSPWLAIVVIVLIPLAAFGIWRLGGSALTKLIRMMALFLVFLVPFSAELVSNGPVLLRSMIYLPIMILVLAAFAANGISGIPQVSGKRVVITLVTSLVLLAVVGQATISNRMFAAAATMSSVDKNLAFLIGQEKDRLMDGAQWTNLPLAVSGSHIWPQGVLTPTREALGSSFFMWDGGSPTRISAFLRSQGVQAHAANATEAEQAWAWLAEMPKYPQPGWIDVRDGILLLNFGPKTSFQEAW